MKPYRIAVPSIALIAAAALAASISIHASHAAASPQSRVSSLSPRERANTSRPRHEKNTVGEGAPAARVSLAQLPMVFEANRGQTDARVKFLARGNGYTLFIAPTAAVLTLRTAEKPHPALADSRHPLPSGEGKEKSLRSPLPLGRGVRGEVNTVAEQVLRIELMGANKHPQIAGLDALPGKANYFIGNDPKKWHTNIPTYAKVELKNVYPGIDLVYHGGQEQSAPSPKRASSFSVIPARVAAAREESRIQQRGGPSRSTDLTPNPFPHREGEPGNKSGSASGLTPSIPLPMNGKGDRKPRFSANSPSSYASRFPRPRFLRERAIPDRKGISGGVTRAPVSPIADHAGEGAAARGLEYDFIVAPNANPNAIRLSFKGAKKIGVVGARRDAPAYNGRLASRPYHSTGDLIVTLADGDKLIERAPVIYQEIAGRRHTIAGGWKLHGAHEAVFKVAGYDHSRPLVIDPALLYSTYLGGSAADYGTAIAIDSAGNAYITGWAESTNFSITAGAFQTRNNSYDSNAFVTKLNANGSGLVYSTYLGGSWGYTNGNAIAIDSAGFAYVAGATPSHDFPITSGAFQTINNGSSYEGIGFVTKLNADGSGLGYSTYLGGSRFDRIWGIAP